MTRRIKFNTEFKREAAEPPRRPQSSISHTAQEIGVTLVTH